MNSSKALIIVGMHRSGTSLTASLLQRSGLNVGEALMGSGAGNTKGHYENMDFYNFHRNILQSLNYDAAGWDEVQIEQLETKHTEEAKKIIGKNESAHWGWKDPRTTLFLNFWATLLPDAHFLFIYRSPVEVIDSFYRRGTDDVIMQNPEKAVDIWLHYNKLILNYHSQYKERSLLLHINTIIQFYPECVEELNKKFNFQLNPDIGHLFDHKIFNKEGDVFKARLLYETRPETRRVYEELMRQSWQPANQDKLPIVYQENEILFREHFFTQWKNQCRHEKQLNRIHQENPHLMPDDEKERKIQALAHEIDWMKNSRFWKIREVWQKVKGIFIK